MSHAAIAAAFGLDGVSTPERLVAFSLASYANREHRAWPSAAAAAARAGMSRGRFLAARDGLVRAGLVAVEDSRGGRGRSSTVLLAFVEGVDRMDAEINAPLFEAALVSSGARGSVRLLVAVMAALADDHDQVHGFTAGELAAAAGLSATSYRRARSALLDTGELVLDSGLGGRGNTNDWTVTLPGAAGPMSLPRPSRVAPPPSALPLLGVVRSPDERCASDGSYNSEPVRKGATPETVSPSKGAAVETVSGGKGAAGGTVSRGKGAGPGMVSGERAPKRAPETAPPHARAGTEPSNLRTCPPSPPTGGSRPSQVTIVEEYVTERGRTRRRRVEIDRAELTARFREPTSTDRRDWSAIRTEMQRIAGETTFAIWLEPLTLRATDPAGALLLAGPSATRAWVVKRFRSLFQRVTAAIGRELRLVDDGEQQLLDGIYPTPTIAIGDGGEVEALSDHTHRCLNHKEAI